MKLWSTYYIQITSDIEIELLRARYILVIEKESVYARLVDDGIIDLAGGMIIITGKGKDDEVLFERALGLRASSLDADGSTYPSHFV